MKINKSFLNYDLITGIDILNTMNGGIIEPTITLSQFPEYRQIEVKAPGISEEALHVTVENNKLIVFYELHLESRDKPVPVPKIVYNKQIPFFVDSKNISAQYQNGTLIVQLPF